jgi:hypothetical protein
VVLCIARVARTQAANFLRLHYLPRSCSKLTPVDLRVETLTRLPWQRGGGVRRAKKGFVQCWSRRLDWMLRLDARNN